ncbi:WD40 repeat-like protein [Neoconidiobolus thromboides FSU 785]|nr:WD40 repeat-like protein [Neoconidiobolus thromboides FSU 785]
MTSFPLYGSSPDPFPSFIDQLGDRKAQGYINKPISDKRYDTNLQCYQKLSNDTIFLSLVIHEQYIIAGCKEGNIKVWNKHSYLLEKELIGHSRAVLCLCVNEKDQLLFSGSSDDTIRVWDLKTLTQKYIINTYEQVGDILSMVYHPLSNTLFFGCQNASIQWFCLDNISGVEKNSEEGGESGKSNFDFKNIPGLPPNSNLKSFFKLNQKQEELKDKENINEENNSFYQIHSNSIHSFAHHGAVYSLIIDNLPDDENEYLFSGSADGSIKIWKINNNNPSLIFEHKILNENKKDILSIYCLQIQNGLLFAGLQTGTITVWDLDTFQKVRTLIGHYDDIMAMSILNNELYSACSNGFIKKWNRNLECIGTMQGHENSILCLISDFDFTLYSSSSDSFIKIWKINNFNSPLNFNNELNNYNNNNSYKIIFEDDLIDNIIHVLEKFILIPSISGSIHHQEDCRLASKFLKNLFLQLGAECKIIKNNSQRNPIVYAKFNANCINTINTDIVKNLLFYGHYDVVSANPKDWDNNNPFILNGKDGYLYGRGITDNKGPIITMIFSIFNLFKKKELKSNVHFLIEGEEESGSIGFYESVASISNLLGNIDLILLSNSYWLGESIPCLTYGLRGVIHASIKIYNNQNDSHSGVYGGVIAEPLIDLTHLLSKLISDKDNKVLIPEFYAKVREITDEESEEYKELIEIFNKIEQNKKVNISNIQQQWREPTFTIHKMDSSGPKTHSTVIPNWARADVSMRIVPDQDINAISQSFIEFIEKLFSQLNSKNKIEITIRQSSNWWLGDKSNNSYNLMREVIKKEWNYSPINIREGGSIPTVPWLETHFKAPALHYPMGQASDQAHLANERLRILNIIKAKNCILDFMKRWAEI